MRKFILCLGCALALALGACLSLPEDQRAYNACVDANNSEFRFKPGPKAIVSGVSDGGTRCYWAWSQPSTAAAIATAMAACQEQSSRCYVFATGDSFASWSQAISDNGGESDGARRARADDAAASAALMRNAATIVRAAPRGSGYQGAPAYSAGYSPIPTDGGGPYPDSCRNKVSFDACAMHGRGCYARNRVRCAPICSNLCNDP